MDHTAEKKTMTLNSFIILPVYQKDVTAQISKWLNLCFCFSVQPEFNITTEGAWKAKLDNVLVNNFISGQCRDQGVTLDNRW